MEGKRIVRTFRIGAFFNRRNKASREQVAGIFDFAARHPEWELHLFARPSSETALMRLVRGFAPDGIIAGHPNIVRALRKRRRRRIPAVIVDYRSPKPLDADCALVLGDAYGAGARCAKCFLGHGFSHFAFAGLSAAGAGGDSEALDSKEEEAGFVNELRAAGHAAAVYRECLPPDVSHFKDGEALATWLRSLPQPTALLVHSDTLALSVYAACRKAGLRIPDKVAVMAVGNEESICEGASPSLSSLEPDYRTAGLNAAMVLDGMMRGRRTARALGQYGVRQLVERLSSRKVSGPRRLAQQAHETIRTRALSGLRVAELTAEAHISQRTLEQAYADLYGMTLRDDLLRLRLNEAKRLLLETTLPIGSIYARCGFRTATALKAAFAKRFAVSMRAFRKGNGLAQPVHDVRPLP